MTSRPKRVLVVTRSTTGHPGSGGMEVVVDDLISRIQGDQFEFALLTTPGANRAVETGLFSHVWTVPHAKAGKYSLRWWLGSAITTSSWAAWNPDIIFSISSAGMSFVLHPGWSSIPVIAQCHGTAWHEVRSSISSMSFREGFKVPLNLVRILRERVAYQRFTRIVAIGPGVVSQLHRPPLGVPLSKINLIANAVDQDFWHFNASARRTIRHSLGIPEDAAVAVFSGRLHAQKGADLALRAMAYMDDASWHLIVCGDGPQLEKLRGLALNLNVECRVHFVGRTKRKALSDILSGSDLLVFPTRRKEGLPMNVLEGLASGLEVLTCQNANLPADLDEFVRYADLNVRTLAEKWSAIPRSRSDVSKLPYEYSLNSAGAAYQTLFLQCVVSA